jgi:hypothetical protein
MAGGAMGRMGAARAKAGQQRQAGNQPKPGKVRKQAAHGLGTGTVVSVIVTIEAEGCSRNL